MVEGLLSDQLFGSEAPADADRWVYHYTRLTNAETIAHSKTLRFNPLSKMNDPREFQPPEPMTLSLLRGVSRPDQHAALSKLRERRLNIRAAAFTTDAADGQPQTFRRANGRGYARPAMWAHYGGNHRGVCFVFNRPALEAALTAKFPGAAFWSRVDYSPGVDAEDWSRYFEVDNITTLGIDGAIEHHLWAYRQCSCSRRTLTGRPSGSGGVASTDSRRGSSPISP